MNIQLAAGGTTSAFGAPTQLELRRCDDGSVHVFSPVGSLAPALTYVGDGHAGPLAGTAIMRISASAEKSKSGTTRVLLKVRLQVPVTNAANASGNMSVTNQEITLHVVAAMPSAFVNALRGAYAVADTTHCSPQNAAEAALAESIGALVSVLTNQTVDVGQLLTELSSLPIYQGALGVCPLNEDAGDYGTSWIYPPSSH